MTKYLANLMADERINIHEERGNVYGLCIVGRGETLFFKENDRGLLCHIDKISNVIYGNSITTWGSHDEDMDKEEQERVLALILKYYKKTYGQSAKIM